MIKRTQQVRQVNWRNDRPSSGGADDALRDIGLQEGDGMFSDLKIVCPPLMCYLLDRVTSADYAALPLVLSNRHDHTRFALYKPDGELYANGKRVHQAHAAKTMRACLSEEMRDPARRKVFTSHA